MSDSHVLTLTELQGVLPILQSKSIGDVTVSLVSLECWGNCLSANLTVVYPSLHAYGRNRTPKLDVHLEDRDGRLHVMEMSTGHGGGSRTGQDTHRSEYRSPSLPLGQPLRLTAKLMLGEYTIPPPPDGEKGGWYGYSPADLEHDWRDIGEFQLDIAVPAILTKPAELLLRKPEQRYKFELRGPSGGDTPSRVIPIVQSQMSDDWLLTLIALECSGNGMLLTSRVQGPRVQRRFIPALRLAVRDDLGNQYVVWPSAGGGDRMTGSRFQWRWYTQVEPALDPNAQALFIDVTPDFNTTEHRMLSSADIDGEAMFAFVVGLGESAAPKSTALK